jgi:hypothetical protein
MLQPSDRFSRGYHALLTTAPHIYLSADCAFLSLTPSPALGSSLLIFLLLPRVYNFIFYQGPILDLLFIASIPGRATSSGLQSEKNRCNSTCS